MGLFGKKVTEMDDRGRVISYKPTRAQIKSTKNLIPATPAPKTKGQKIARTLWK